MSIQKADAYLNALKQNLAVVAVAGDIGVGPTKFLQDVLAKQGWPANETAGIQPLLDALVEVVKAP